MKKTKFNLVLRSFVALSALAALLGLSACGMEPPMNSDLATKEQNLVQFVTLPELGYSFNEKVKVCKTINYGFDKVKVCSPSVRFEADVKLKNWGYFGGVPVEVTVEVKLKQPVSMTLSFQLHLSDGTATCTKVLGSNVSPVEALFCVKALNISTIHHGILDNKKSDNKFRLEFLARLAAHLRYKDLNLGGVSKSLTLYKTPNIIQPFL